MKLLTNESFVGTGNSQLSSDYIERLRILNNIPITIEHIKEFISISKIKPCKITLSMRITKSRWGTAWCDKKERIILYRHSVGVYLHEFAHVLNNRMGLFNKAKPHGLEFAKFLEWLIDEWETTPFKNNH